MDTQNAEYQEKIKLIEEILQFLRDNGINLDNNFLPFNYFFQADFNAEKAKKLKEEFFSDRKEALKKELPQS